MKCPKCNTENDKKQKFCTQCGTPLKGKGEADPKLNKVTIGYSIIGTLLLMVFGFIYYTNHANDPEFLRTPGYLEPDTTLADKNAVVFDTLSTDTIANDSADESEKEEATKIYNSIRGRQNSSMKAVVKHTDEELQAEGEASADVPSNESGSAATSTPAPKVEEVGTE